MAAAEEEERRLFFEGFEQNEQEAAESLPPPSRFPYARFLFEMWRLAETRPDFEMRPCTQTECSRETCTIVEPIPDVFACLESFKLAHICSRDADKCPMADTREGSVCVFSGWTSRWATAKKEAEETFRDMIHKKMIAPSHINPSHLPHVQRPLPLSFYQVSWLRIDHESRLTLYRSVRRICAGTSIRTAVTPGGRRS